MKQYYFIDRDGHLFRHVLNYLRTGRVCLPARFEELDQLIEEARFYQLDGMTRQLEGLLYQRARPTATLHPPPPPPPFPLPLPLPLSSSSSSSSVSFPPLPPARPSRPSCEEDSASEGAPRGGHGLRQSMSNRTNSRPVRFESRVGKTVEGSDETADGMAEWGEEEGSKLAGQRRAARQLMRDECVHMKRGGARKRRLLQSGWSQSGEEVEAKKTGPVDKALPNGKGRVQKTGEKSVAVLYMSSGQALSTEDGVALKREEDAGEGEDEEEEAEEERGEIGEDELQAGLRDWDLVAFVADVGNCRGPRRARLVCSTRKLADWLEPRLGLVLSPCGAGAGGMKEDTEDEKEQEEEEGARSSPVAEAPCRLNRLTMAAGDATGALRLEAMSPERMIVLLRGLYRLGFRLLPMPVTEIWPAERSRCSGPAPTGFDGSAGGAALDRTRLLTVSADANCDSDRTQARAQEAGEAEVEVSGRGSLHFVMARRVCPIGGRLSNCRGKSRRTTTGPRMGLLLESRTHRSPSKVCRTDVGQPNSFVEHR
ncbi:unnamed protein product [Protopolystoma xenopodis]|uniref:Potassium channel tetramerisation-type BTB domain-containing protein n=1 Tax=Protopolystoma xenopodis TaxID=117903 RepID=A0A448XNV6_9PLAT|nr:unnamed protein product [Protopolystoma xenopodis]